MGTKIKTPSIFRFIEFLLSVLTLFLLLPFLLFVSLVIWLSLGSPILYIQERIGKQCEKFSLYKFRTMTLDFGKNGKLLPDQARVTKLGNLLRKTSVDELPSLFNIIKGDMSFVGPRPLLVEYLERYTPEQARRHEVRPGITGWAQVNGRNTLSWEERFKLDVWYVDNKSFLLDLKIILMTIVKVIKKEGISPTNQVTMEEFRGTSINILFTSVGRRVELVQQWNMVLKQNNISGNIIGTDIDPLAPALQYLDKRFIVPRTNSQNFISTIVELCKKYNINLIFPLIDPDIPVLAKNRRLFEEAGTKLVLIGDKFIQTTQDKWLTNQFFKSLGLHSPESWLPESINNFNELSFPIFIKPRSGSASKGAEKIESPVQFENILPKTKGPILQEFIEGTEITCDVICSLNGQVLSVIPRQRIEVRWGEVAKGKTINHPIIIQNCVKIARALKAIGPITVQCILKNNIPYYIEINPRYGGGAPLGIAAGAKSPEWLIKELLDIPFSTPPLGQFVENLYMTRADQSIFLTEKEIGRIKSSHI